MNSRESKKGVITPKETEPPASTPTPEPTVLYGTREPTSSPAPTVSPTKSFSPTGLPPTQSPMFLPTQAPTTDEPTFRPTYAPCAGDRKFPLFKDYTSLNLLIYVSLSYSHKCTILKLIEKIPACPEKDQCRSPYGFCGPGEFYCNEKAIWMESCGVPTDPPVSLAPTTTSSPSIAPSISMQPTLTPPTGNPSRCVYSFMDYFGIKAI